MAWDGQLGCGVPLYHHPGYDRPLHHMNNTRNFSSEGLDTLSYDALVAYIHNRFGPSALRESNVPETPKNRNNASRRYHGNSNTGHAYGDPVIDGYGTTVLGDMTQYYILSDTSRHPAQTLVTPKSPMLRGIQGGRALQGSQYQRHALIETARSRQLEPSNHHVNGVRRDSAASSRGSKLMTPTRNLSFRSSSSQTNSEHLTPLSQQSDQPKNHVGLASSAASTPVTEPTNATRSILSWQEAVAQQLQLRQGRPASVKKQSLLHVTAAFGDSDRSYNPHDFDCFSEQSHVTWAHSTVDATDVLKGRTKTFNAVFIKDFPFTMSMRHARYRFLNTLVDYTRNGGTTIFHGWQQGPGVDYFFSEICSLPWRVVEGDPTPKWYAQNADSWLQPEDSSPKTLQRAASELQHVASKDLLYEANGEPNQGPFAITQYGKGRIGWFGDTFDTEQLQRILLSMLGLLDDAEPAPSASPANSPRG